MSSKAKVRSMQRGAHKREKDRRPGNQDLYEKVPPRLTDREKVHFGLGTRTVDSFITKLAPILLACHKSRMPAARICDMLNERQIRTACGDPWTPRLAWFLMATWRKVHFAQSESPAAGSKPKPVARPKPNTRAAPAPAREPDKAPAHYDMAADLARLRDHFS